MPYRVTDHSGDPGGAVPHGIETILERNSLRIGDNYLGDRYCVYGIDGLASPEIRDDREVNPGRDGETAFDAFYSGRNILIEGRVEAGNNAKMRQMIEDLRTNFNDLSEVPMYFRRYSWLDDFSVDKLASCYTIDQGAGTFSVAGGKITPSSTATKRFIYRDFSYKDSSALLKFTTGTTFTSASVGLILKELDSNNYLRGRYTATSTLQIEKVIAGTPTSLASITIPTLSASVEYWLLFRIEDSYVTLELWGMDPVERDVVNRTQLPLQLGGAESTVFGTGISGKTGVYFVPGDTSWSVDDFQIDSMEPADVYVTCRPTTPLALKEEQQSADRFERNFLLTLRASDPTFYGTVLKERTLTLSNPPATDKARSYDRGYDLRYTTYVSASGSLDTSNTLTTTNVGNADSFPIVRLYGPIFGAILIIGDDVFRLSKDITAGDYIEIDFRKRKVTNAAGDNAYSYVDPESTWLSLPPGTSTIIVTSLTFFTGAKAYVWWRDTWL